QDRVLAPDAFGLGYIRIQGLTIEHAANGFPRPQTGALSTRRGHHWIIQDNIVRQVNSIGIDIGDQFDVEGPALAEGGCHIVRRNHISDCGIGGLEGKSVERTLIEDNRIQRCGWHDVLQIYETGGIKVHCTRSTLVWRNRVLDTIGGPGIWMDYANVNSRCSRNVVIDTDSSNGAIFMEASQQPNLVDQNIIWGCRGNGIYQHDCDELTIAHNLVVHAGDAGIRMKICNNRMVMGRLSTAKRNTIVGNVLIDNGSPLAISDPDNVSDNNLIDPGAAPYDLTAWRGRTGWDAHSVIGHAHFEWDRDRLQLSWSIDTAGPAFPRLTVVTRDFFDKPRPEETLAGPFAAASLSCGPLCLRGSPAQ
ncbi:MAG: right-handed parallel beta-helix repeat-containing protein, partial [Planctomycetes bacterium]|nr:right-handed parallel beta-helix repeat-containing protein [Planctomycetota bacterium]